MPLVFPKETFLRVVTYSGMREGIFKLMNEKSSFNKDKLRVHGQIADNIN